MNSMPAPFQATGMNFAWSVPAIPYVGEAQEDRRSSVASTLDGYSGDKMNGKGMVPWADYLDDDQDEVATPRGQGSAPFNAAWSRLRTPSPEIHVRAAIPTAAVTPQQPKVVVTPPCEEESDDMTTICVLAQPERGLARLPRKWRTPDPSPSCLPDGERMRSGKVANAFIVPTYSNSQRGPRQTSRGPMSNCSTDTATEDFEESPWARLRTPSPEGAYPVWKGATAGIPAPVCHPLLMNSSYRPSRSRSPLRSKEEETLAVPPPPAPVSASGEDRPTGWSVGAEGHPHTCEQPCKYFWKASGCKDGEKCVRCHLCRWTRPRKKASAAAAGAKPAAGEAMTDRKSEQRADSKETRPICLSQVVQQPAAPKQRVTLSLVGAV